MMGGLRCVGEGLGAALGRGMIVSIAEREESEGVND